MICLDGAIQAGMQVCACFAQFEHVAQYRNSPPARTDLCMPKNAERRRHRSRIGVIALVDQGDLAAGHHEVVADAASFSMTIENVPSENPRTGRITALSVVRMLRKRRAEMSVGT